MLKKIFVPVALSGLLIASPFAVAVDEHHPEQAAAATQDDSSVEKALGDATVAPSGMTKPETMSGAKNSDSPGGMMTGRPGMMGPGMMQGGSGMMGQRMMGGHGKGMMGQGMMHKHQQVVNRLDLLDARMAKIETLLERLIQR